MDKFELKMNWFSFCFVWISDRTNRIEYITMAFDLISSISLFYFIFSPIFLWENNVHYVFFFVLLFKLIQVMVSVDSDKRPTITGGPLSGTYEFAQLHFHWGENDTMGSEDSIDGHR